MTPEAREEAYARFGKPEIINTDQGSQFTAQVFVDAVLRRGVKLSMDGQPDFDSLKAK